MGKVTYQVTPTARSSFMFNRNLKDRFHRRDSPYLFVEDKATVLQDQPAQNFVVQLNQVLGRSLVVDARIGRMWGTFPTRYQADVQPTDIALRDTVRDHAHQRRRDSVAQPEPPLSGQRNGELLPPDVAGGNHDFKAGLQLSWEKMEYERIRNGDILLEMQRRSAVPGADLPIPRSTPIIGSRLGGCSCRIAGRSAGPRSTSVCGWTACPAICRRSRVPAGTFVGERSFARTDVFDFSFNVAPRIGVSYDLLGNGRTAVKAYYGRFYNQFGSEILEDVERQRAGHAERVWRDSNGNLRLDAGELGATSPVRARSVPAGRLRMSTRPYSDEINIGVEHQLVANLSVGVSYHRRQHRNGLGIVDRARPSSAYTPEDRTFTDSDGSYPTHHGLQTRSGARHTARPSHHQRGRPARATTTACSSTSRSACPTAGKCWQACRSRTTGFRPQRDLHQPGRRTRLQQPELPAEP